MKKLLMVSNGGHFALRIAKAMLVVFATLALGTMFWVASTPRTHAQNMSPAAMLQAELPQGQTVAAAGKADFLAALCAAVQKHHGAAPQIVRFAAETHPDWKNDILRTAFRCLGNGDCRLLGRVLAATIAADSNDASALTDLATQLSPDCAGAFGAAGGVIQEDNGGNFGPPPGNLNPPPGSIGGGGGQGNVIAICHNGRTIFVSPQGAEQHLRNHPGDTLGACQVTPVTNR